MLLANLNVKTGFTKKKQKTFYKKVLQKIDQKEFRAQKVIKRKGDKLYVKWKSYYNSFDR